MHIFTRLLLIVLSLLIPFAGAGPIYGAMKTPINPKILENSVPPPNPIRKDPQVGSKAPWGYGLTFASRIDFFRKLLQGTSRQTKYTIKTVNAGEHGRELEQGAVKLMPKTLQDNYVKLITYDQHMTGNHNSKYHDEEGGDCHPEDRGIFHPVAIGWNKVRGGTKWLYNTWSTGTLPLEGLNFYQTLPDERVAPDNGFCDRQDEGFHVGLFDYGDVDVYYDGTGEDLWTAEEFCGESALVEQDACIEENKNLPPEEQKSCDIRCSEGAHTNFSTRIPAAEEVAAELGINEDGGKMGFTYAFIPAAAKLIFGHGTNEQPHTLDIPICSGCDILSEKAAYYGEMSRRQHMDAMNCGNTSKNDPNYNPDICGAVPVGNDLLPPGPITSEVGNPGGPLSCSASAEQFPERKSPLETAIVEATRSVIPRCVLDGVAIAEGAKTEQGAEIPQACVPNECSATGPFQITVGFTYANQGGQCSTTTTCADCGGLSGDKTCPNAIKYYLSNIMPGFNPCDTKQAAKAAVSMLIGKAKYFGTPLPGPTANLNDPAVRQSIIVAGDSYFGSTKPLSGRFGGLSYGEFVLSKCVPGVTHTDHSFPAPGGAQQL